jgi:hypothetical protein
MTRHRWRVGELSAEGVPCILRNERELHVNHFRNLYILVKLLRRAFRPVAKRFILVKLLLGDPPEKRFFAFIGLVF